ncbi:hypothetical protein [Saccharothrix sp. HUAS TT1]|uniref:hypothetical protein n=1 Tax=unclassified Saccharothrix TaxID=2593673 RepID=UPI00345C09B5
MFSPRSQVTAESPYPVPNGADGVAEWYRRRLGWHVEVEGGEVRLPLTGGLVAFEVPVHLAEAVLTRLADLGATRPALRTGERGDRVAFLCDANDSVFTQADMPVGVAHLRSPKSLRLPGTPTAWFSAPEPDRGWLPSAGAVLHAVRRTLAAARAV